MGSKVDDFIGKVITTRKGNDYVIHEKLPERVCGAWKYIYTCNVCSLDSDIWPYGSLCATKNNLTSGNVACGCGKAFWTERQRRVLVQRLCDEVGYIFHSWAEDYKGTHTKLDLENKVTGNRWRSCSINNFLRGKRDPSRRMKGASKPVEFHIKEIKRSRCYPQGTKFSRKGEVWFVECPVCKEDEFSKVGKLPYTFKSCLGVLKGGCSPCRCSKGHTFTQEEWKFRVDQICKRQGITFLGLDGERFKSRGRINWVCSEGHKRNNNLECFIVNNGRCHECSDGFNGYYPTRKDETDFLYIYNFDNTYIKIGRSFNVLRREGELINASGCTTATLLHTFTASHQAIYELEQYLHAQLRAKGLSYNSGWTSESFKLESLPLALELIAKENVEVCCKGVL